MGIFNRGKMEFGLVEQCSKEEMDCVLWTILHKTKSQKKRLSKNIDPFFLCHLRLAIINVHQTIVRLAA
jgi:hypothetical protein